MNNRHLGSDFDEFLAEENLLERVTAVATKRVMADQITETSIAVQSPGNSRAENRLKKKPNSRIS